MKLYHIHKPNKYDELYKEESTILVGNNYNAFTNDFFNRSGAYLKNSVEKDGQIYDYYSNITELLENEKIANMSEEEKKKALEVIRTYVHNSEMDMREMILEQVREACFSHLPSRRYCMWLTDEDSIETWMKNLRYSDGYQLFEVEADGNIFVSTNKLLPCGHHRVRMIYEESFRYWNPQEEDLRDAKDKEYLFEGNLRILRRVK